MALAKALINRPELLLLDEPTASLDPDTGDWVRTWLERYRDESGCTILLASHNMAEVERLCSHVLMLKQGRIVDRGSPQELLDRYGREDMEEVFLDIARDRRARRMTAASGMTTRAAARRIWGLMYRHLALYRRSWPRLLELAYWPVLQMCIWGFTASFLATRMGSAGGARRRHAAGRRAAVGGGAAQPDGRGDQLPGGDVVAQPGPRLRQPDAAVGAGGGADPDVGDPHAGGRAAGDPGGLAAVRLQPVRAGAGAWCCSSST